MGDTSAVEGLRLLVPFFVGAFVAMVVFAALAWRWRRTVAQWLSGLTGGRTASEGATTLAVLAALGILAFFAGIELVATSLFFAGRTIVPFVVVAASAIAAIVLLLGTHSLVERTRVLQVYAVVVITCVLVSVFGLFAASRLYDVSWDGQWIHQEAAVVLANGWNPVADPLGHTAKVGSWRPQLDSVVWTTGIENFSKGMWIRTAALYAFTRHIETSKAGNVILLFVQFVVWFALALRLAPKRWWTATLVGALAALNPIVTVQLFTHKNDGQLGSLFTIALGLGLLALGGSGGWPAILGACLAILMLCTVKFTGLVYAVVLVVGLVIALLALGRFGANRTLVASLAATLVVAVLFTGFNPYVFNTRYYGNPFYPLVGRGSVDTLTDQSPRDFAAMTNAERFLRSIFSKAEDELLGGTNAVTTRLKVPFTIQASEFRPYLGFDTRVAGFGPLFGGALLMAFVLVVLLFFEWRRTHSRLIVVGVLVLVAITLSVFANPAAWWARYVPQLWLVPVVAAALALLTSERGARVWLAWALCAVLVANTAFVGTVNFANVVHGTHEIDVALDRVGTWHGRARVRTGEFRTSWTKLQERGVSWDFAGSGVPATQGLTVPYTTMTVYEGRPE